jgi:flagellar biosynthesis protein FliQ
MRETSFRNDIISRTLTIYANLIFVVLWVGFVIALVVNREWLDELWIWAQALPSVPKIIVWVLFLPIMVGLWIWESSWPTIGRLVGFTSIVAWTLLAVYSLFKFFR